MAKPMTGTASILALCAALFAVSCSSPLDRVERLSDVQVVENDGENTLPTPAMAAEPEPYVAAKGGLFSRVIGRNRADRQQAKQVDAALGTVVVVDAPAATDADTQAAAPMVAAMQGEAAQPPAGEKPAQKEKRGLLGFLKKDSDKKPDQQKEEAIETASLSPVLPEETQAAPLKKPKKQRGGGFFGARTKKIDPNAPDALQVPAGTVLPYGKLARMCDGNPKSMGKEVAHYPERSPKYRLYDTAPGSATAHTFLLTGFPDGCARQFTAALALFGGPGMHETLRYGLPAKTQPYSETDRAYERVKSAVCKVGKNKPCGAKLSRLEKDTVFLSVYERFGDNARWANILLHDGAVMAQDLKSK